GYRDYKKDILLGGKRFLDLGNIHMKTVAIELDTVLIKSHFAPIIFKKDTVEFNARSFRTRPNARLEELLKKIPGVDVDDNGSITYNGKPVSKLLVDGNEFFGNDILVATRNLQESMVDR